MVGLCSHHTIPFTEYPHGRTSVPHTLLPSPQNILHLPSLFIYETIHKKHSTQHRAFSHTTHPHSAHSHSTCPQSIPQQCWGTVAVGGPLPTHDRWLLTQRQINMNGLGSEGTSISCPLPLPLCAPEIEGGAGGFKEFSTYLLLKALGCYDQRGQ